MDVYTHTSHIYVQTTCKVNLASDDPFKCCHLAFLFKFPRQNFVAIVIRYTASESDRPVCHTALCHNLFCHGLSIGFICIMINLWVMLWPLQVVKTNAGALTFYGRGLLFCSDEMWGKLINSVNLVIIWHMYIYMYWLKYWRWMNLLSRFYFVANHQLKSDICTCDLFWVIYYDYQFLSYI